MIDFTKPVRTRSGLEARVFMTDGGGDYPLLGAIRLEHGEWILAKWSDAGIYYIGESATHPYNLIQVQEKIKGWLNVYSDGYLTAHRSGGIAREEAAGKQCKAIAVPFEVELP